VATLDTLELIARANGLLALLSEYLRRILCLVADWAGVVERGRRASATRHATA